MNLSEPQGETLREALPSQSGPSHVLAAHLPTALMQCRCGFQMERPR